LSGSTEAQRTWRAASPAQPQSAGADAAAAAGTAATASRRARRRFCGDSSQERHRAANSDTHANADANADANRDADPRPDSNAESISNRQDRTIGHSEAVGESNPEAEAIAICFAEKDAAREGGTNTAEETCRRNKPAEESPKESATPAAAQSAAVSTTESADISVKASAGGAGGRGTGPGGPSQVTSYSRLLHDRFYKEWVQPTSVVAAGTKMSALVKIRIEKDGRVPGSTSCVHQATCWSTIPSPRRPTRHPGRSAPRRDGAVALRSEDEFELTLSQ
jgi:hypothetical protein